MLTTVSRTPQFRLRSGDSWRDPFDMYRELREYDPVHRVVTPPDGDDPGEYWVLTRHADVWAAAADATTFSSAQGLTVIYGELEAIGMADNPPLVMQDPPVHTRFRKLVARGFTPRQVVDVEPRVREFVVARLDEMADGAADIVGQLFKPLPSMVVAHYLGVPESDWSRFDGWTQAIVGANAAGGLAAVTAGGGSEASGSDQISAGDATAEMLGYFSELITFRRDHPGDDTVSALVESGRAEDPAGLLSILAFAFTMVAGGNDTTTGMLGGGVELLAADPDQRRLLVNDPSLIPGAVEELLRLTSPVQGLARTTTADVRYADTPRGPVTIPEGRKVLLCYASANRDPHRFGPDAEHLDVLREPRSILTFSHGNHHCLGAAAARMQARVALTELLARYPDFDVDPAGIRWASGNYVRRPDFVPFHPGRHA
ncbi:MAG TPA: cytochrome P450 [Gordonia sp. (in: high G+C Gram-positive bacteria)]|uniref:cytochrome P450 n=1 Tax=unclassified Gordonia (in: high G+C Gram-positive bacteria) TaxID=2657482 RepID=UPI0025B98BA8|nr:MULTISPECIES: cytochrome P450 [unclassified Gordonia (in: high G+C Gram-positive bacteria)]HNP57010.1 cytochrome P450 [Gordonia sp. (in: high G+C Gram-positive bacteria)]HRC50973.1 cytochrome P450 [Gordonia sp. (in: high G+C Gram-positive bacteria)]